jgi:hypothetical protein
VSGDWSDLGSTFNGAIYAFAFDELNDILYVGGTFTSPHSGIAKYSGGSWSAVGAGLNAAVWTLELAPDGDLYVGGVFTDLQGGGGTNLNYIARWDGSSYNALGTGMNQSVRAVRLGRSGNVYVGGNFTTGNGVTLNYFGYWNGTTFVAMDSGVGASVLTLAVDRSDNVYLGGTFVTAGAGAATVNRITKWNGSSYEALDTGVSSTVERIVIDEAGYIYVGGDFATASGITVNKVALWSGSGWDALDSGVSGGDVYRLAIYKGLLWVGGDFTSASGLATADRLAIWNGSAWVHADIDLPGTPNVYEIYVTERDIFQDVYLGFDSTGTATYAVDTTVTNNGSVSSYPILTLWNEGSTNTGITHLNNETTGATFWMDYTLQPGEKITINFNLNNFSVTSNYFGDVSEMILGGSNEDFYLAKGSNIITIFTPDASITADLTWRNAHGYADGVAT